MSEKVSECFTSIKQLMPYADVHFVSVKILFVFRKKRKVKNKKNLDFDEMNACIWQELFD